jgi:hypothetical protein
MSAVTPQQLDPLGGTTTRVFSIAAAVLAVAIGVVMTLMPSGDTTSPAPAVAALAATTAAAGYLVYASSAFRAPFGRIDHSVVCLLSLAAVVLGTAAQWRTNELVRDDWAPLSMAVLTIALAAYRPAWEMVVSSLVLSAFIAAIVLAQPSHLRSDVPDAVFAVFTVTPVLAAGLAAAAYSHSLVRGLLAARGDDEAGEPADALPTRSRHLVHLDEVVLPFLDRVAADGVVGAADGQRARALAREMTSLMVLDAERSWVTRLLGRVSDPGRLADRMNAVERGFVRAVVAHAASNDSFASGTSVEFAAAADGAPAKCVLRIPIVAGANPRVAIAPYVAVARSVFVTVDCQFTPDAVVLALAFRPDPGEQALASGV